MENKLHIKSDDFEFSLSGDEEFVETTYDSMRKILRAKYVDTLHQPKNRNTLPLHPVEMEQRTHLSAIICNEVYLKVHLMEIEEMSNTLFGKTFDLFGVNRMFFNRSQQETFDKKFEFGKVLWRELTTKGREAIKGVPE